MTLAFIYFKQHFYEMRRKVIRKMQFLTRKGYKANFNSISVS